MDIEDIKVIDLEKITLNQCIYLHKKHGISTIANNGKVTKLLYSAKDRFIKSMRNIKIAQRLQTSSDK